MSRMQMQCTFLLSTTSVLLLYYKSARLVYVRPKKLATDITRDWKGVSPSVGLGQRRCSLNILAHHQRHLILPPGDEPPFSEKNS